MTVRIALRFISIQLRPVEFVFQRNDPETLNVKQVVINSRRYPQMLSSCVGKKNFCSKIDR